jgi:hypothetical protein
MFGGMKRPERLGCDQRRRAGIRRGVEDRLPAWPEEDSAAIVDNGGISAVEVASNSVLPAEPDSPMPPLLLIVALPALPKILVSPPEPPPSLL